ncbi:MAG: hypothetical protein KG003_11480 [Bacteroidetes bacterium]|nr:hypothetical protein [Bacteroidota bacterium]
MARGIYHTNENSRSLSQFLNWRLFHSALKSHIGIVFITNPIGPEKDEVKALERIFRDNFKICDIRVKNNITEIFTTNHAWVNAMSKYLILLDLDCHGVDLIQIFYEIQTQKAINTNSQIYLCTEVIDQHKLPFILKDKHVSGILEKPITSEQIQLLFNSF